MATLTEAGLVTLTLPQILEELNSACKTKLSSDWDSSSNNVINILNGIYAERLLAVENGIRVCYDSSSPQSASDISLDYAVSYANIRRIAASKTYTPLEVTGTVGSIVPLGTIVDVADVGTRFLFTEALTLTNTQFADISITTSSVVDSTNYSITVDSEVNTINSGVAATSASILNALAAEITSNVAGVTVTLPTSTSLRIDVTEVDSVLPIVVGAGLSVTSVSDIALVEAKDSGAVIAPKETLTVLPVPIAGITGVTNRSTAIVGRLEETDEELRIRRYNSVGSNGVSTYNAISGKVSNLTGVEFATVNANSGASTDSSGVPSKAFEVVVFGGEDDLIARTIFENAPIGIESYGDVSKVVTDTEGNPQVVRFSRPTNVFIHVNCVYKDYSEEKTSVTTATAIRNAILSYGNSLPVGKDVIPQRFLGGIYNATSGVGEVTITLSKSYDGILVNPFTTSVLEVDRRELPNFREDLITVTKV